MTDIDKKLEKYSVKVNNGSGCLIQPRCEEYTYVLTAKHCIWDKGKNKVLAYDQIKVERDSGEIFKVNEAFSHQSFDVAILKIDRLVEIDLFFTIDEPLDKEELIMYGFPQRRRGGLLEEDKIYCIVGTEKEDFIEIKANQPLTTNEKDVIDNTKGFSGCGVYRKEGNTLLLMGIVSILGDKHGVGGSLIMFKMRVLFEVVTAYKISDIFPHHLCTFNSYKEEIWNEFSPIPQLKGQLEEKAESVMNKNVSPEIIIDYLRENLCVPPNRNLIYERKLWAGWLEFLVYNTFLFPEKKSKAINFIKAVLKENNQCFFYSNKKKDWIYIAKEILEQNIRGTKENVPVNIVINTNTDKPPLFPKLDGSAIVRQIDRATGRKSKFNIDEGRSPLSSCLFIHLYEFKEKLRNKRDYFQRISSGDEELIVTEIKESIVQGYKNEERN